MEKFQYTITDSLGIHARPAGMVVRIAMKFQSQLMMTNQFGQSVDLKKIFKVMGLGVKCGDHLVISAQGEDEQQAIVALHEYFTTYL